MRNTLISLILILTICLTPSAQAYADTGMDARTLSAGYSDVPADHWAAESVARATQLGLFQGVSSGCFGMGQPISRAAFVTALGRLFDWETASPDRDTFTDVTPDRWFYSAVETARANDAISVDSRTFRPTEDITREEMASMLIRSLGYTSLAGVASRYSSPFTDVTTNKGFLIVAHDLGVVSGVTDGNFSPSGTATREQAAAMLVRVHDRLSARSVQLADMSGYQAVTVATPAPQAGAELPTTPLEPLTELYDTLRTLKNSGADMDQAALRLTAGGVRTLVSGQSILSTEPVTAQEVESLLEQEDVNEYYSDRYESAYAIRHLDEETLEVVWYQSEKSLAAKLQLGRLFGVTSYVLE